MKKVLCLIFAAVFLLLAAGCAATPQEVPVLPPSRIGNSNMQASFEKSYTFESALSEADVVARIQVGNWLGEDAGNLLTYFEATVLQCFKGEIPETFTLIQDGCSVGTLKGYPLFTSGNELLVFLDEGILEEYASPYWIIGSFMTIMDVTYDNSGTRYYADRHGFLGESVDISTNYAHDGNIYAQVYSKSVASDPIIANMGYTYPYVFSESDLTALLNEC